MRLFRRISEFGRASLGRILFIAAVALVLLIWNIHVRLNDDGIIRGVVVSPEGNPVREATVQLREQTLNLVKEPLVETTGEQGNFVFRDIEMIEFVISAKKEGYGTSERHRYHLIFMGQNFELPKPLVLETGS